MNNNHLQQIFSHYIDKFDMINNSEHQEYYKWQIAKEFRHKMDDALDAPTEEFAVKLLEVKKFSENLIDSYTQPFYGLCMIAKEKGEAETVRSMFRDLLKEDNNDLKERQIRIHRFLQTSHNLREKYYPESFLYKNDMHSVTSYLFLYNPDNNYIFKASHAAAFADCTEFYNDWGSGDAVDLEVYYRMCDDLVASIKCDEELLKTDASRYDNGWGIDPDTLHKDSEKHILAFDIIYCCSTYELYDGISFVRPKSKERQLIRERKAKAQELSEILNEVKKSINEIDKAKGIINSILVAGKCVHHKKYGNGVIKKNDGTNIVVEFEGLGEKLFNTFMMVSNEILSLTSDAEMEIMNKYKSLLKNEKGIKTRFTFIEKDFAQYSEYLD